MDGQLDGEIISTVLFNGSNQQPVNPTGSSLPVKATGLPFKFNITIRAPFRALLNTAESFTDVRTTVRQAATVAEDAERSEEHTSELQSLMRISYAVFCLKKTK